MSIVCWCVTILKVFDGFEMEYSNNTWSLTASTKFDFTAWFGCHLCWCLTLFVAKLIWIFQNRNGFLFQFYQNKNLWSLFVNYSVVFVTTTIVIKVKGSLNDRDIVKPSNSTKWNINKVHTCGFWKSKIVIGWTKPQMHFPFAL